MLPISPCYGILERLCPDSGETNLSPSLQVMEAVMGFGGKIVSVYDPHLQEIEKKHASQFIDVVQPKTLRFPQYELILKSSLSIMALLSEFKEVDKVRLGTAFVIGPHHAITARHCIDHNGFQAETIHAISVDLLNEGSWDEAIKLHLRSDLLTSIILGSFIESQADRIGEGLIWNKRDFAILERKDRAFSPPYFLPAQTGIAVGTRFALAGYAQKIKGDSSYATKSAYFHYQVDETLLDEEFGGGNRKVVSFGKLQGTFDNRLAFHSASSTGGMSGGPLISYQDAGVQNYEDGRITTIPFIGIHVGTRDEIVWNVAVHTSHPAFILTYGRWVSQMLGSPCFSTLPREMQKQLPVWMTYCEGVLPQFFDRLGLNLWLSDKMEKEGKQKQQEKNDKKKKKHTNAKKRNREQVKKKKKGGRLIKKQRLA